MKIRQFFRNLNYRHYICIAITFGFLACGVFVFPNALGRLIEGVRDFALSVAYFFCGFFGIESRINPTVNELPKIPFFDFLSGSSVSTAVMPETWDSFKASWSSYWGLWASKGNIVGYLIVLGNILLSTFPVILLLIVALFLVRLCVWRYLNKQNNYYGVETRPLQVFKRISNVTYRPIRIFLLGIVAFIREHKTYWIIWVCLWAYYFNFFTIVLELFAYLFYFVISFDFVDLYRQVYKLCVDLSVVVSFVPRWAWALFILWGLNWLSKKRGYAKLNHRERCNRGFLNERGVLNDIFGYPGAGKTLLETDMALSYEVQILDDALEVILETDMHFPFFPWINLENELKRAIRFHVVYDVWSCRRWIRKKQRRWEQGKTQARLFGYDYERYGLTYDNKLYIADVWQALEDYARAYLIYTVQSSYIIGNYSIRSDKMIEDLGNFPLWDTDFFKRDSRLIDSFSRHSHILDFDMLRLGKKMLEDNPNRNAFGFGVYVVTEIDKERKNSPELQEVKRNADECNQKNDLYNVTVKMARHACVIANRVFVHVLGDLQRTGSLNSDLLQLGDTIEVLDKDEMKPALPWWSPFWIYEFLCSLVIGKFNKFYLQSRFNRADSTLFLYILKGIVAVVHNYRERMNNIFGSQVLHVRVVRGTDDRETKDCKWFRQSKKIFSKRYSTDCLSAIWEVRGEVNAVGIDDLREYADIMATQDELEAQHSHFQSDISLLKKI